MYTIFHPSKMFTGTLNFTCRTKNGASFTDLFCPRTALYTSDPLKQIVVCFEVSLSVSVSVYSIERARNLLAVGQGGDLEVRSLPILWSCWKSLYANTKTVNMYLYVI